MTWLFRYRSRAFLRSSLCVTPILSMGAALLAAPILRWLDERTNWTLLGFGLDGSKMVIGALASSLLTLIVFAFSIILLAIQVASGQLSPRIIARVLESRLTKQTLGVFAFSFTYTMAVLGRIEDRVPQLPVFIAVFLSLGCVALFLFLIQTAGQSFRPVVIMTQVAADTRAAIDKAYPRPFQAASEQHLDLPLSPAPAPRTVFHDGPARTVLAFHLEGLIQYAGRNDCRIEIAPQVGDLLAPGEPIFRLSGTGAGSVDEATLRGCVALGRERALENDPAFGFRILVDIAAKALSPAINDPATGVLALDQIQHLLRLLSQRQLGTGAARDSAGELRLLYATPGWADYVSLGLTDIRIYGATNPQVSRRLSALLRQLLQEVPAARAGPLRLEAALLARTIERSFADPEDRCMAAVPDLQGFGSPRQVTDREAE
jgi:uncharacterized membrane protein